MKAFSLFFFLGLTLSHAAVPSKTNIAKGKPYTIEPQPNYIFCTDADDAIQLTDGKFATSPGFWNDMAAIGWKSGSAGVSLMVIDLGEYSAISKVVVNTAAREKVGAYFPDVFLATSEDGKTFTPIDVTYDKPRLSDPNDLIRSSITLDGFLTGGRYLAVALRNASPSTPSFMFTDEIQVFSSDLDPRTGQAGSQKLSREEFKAYIASKVSGSIEDQQIIAELEGRISSVSDSAKASAFRAELKALSEGPREERDPKADLLRAQIWQHQFPGQRLIFWSGTPWKNFTSLTAEPSETREPLQATVVQGSYGCAVVNLANVSAEAFSAEIELAGESGGIRLRQSTPIRSVGHKLLGDPLPLLDSGRLSLAAGQATQLWLDIDARAMASGPRKISVNVKADGSVTEIPVVIHVAAFAFPKTLPLKTYAWSYLNNFGLTKGEFGPPAARDLADHYVNCYIFPPSALPKGKFDAQGNLQGELDFSAFDRELELASFASDYFFFFGWRPTGSLDGGFFSGLPWMSPPWKTALKQWLQAWKKHLDAKGISSDRVLYYPIDEYAGTALSDVAAQIKEALPEARVLCLPRIKKEPEEIAWIQKYNAVIDVWMPLLHVIDHQPKVLEALHATERPVWAYDARGPGKEMDPHVYYRLPFWKGLAAGLTGYGFWAYNDAGYIPDNAWSDFDTSIGDAAVIYTSKHAPEGVSRSEMIITSRRWESWRQGVIDYVVMDAALKKLAGDPAKLEALRQQIRNVVSTPDNVELADQTRNKALREVFGDLR